MSEPAPIPDLLPGEPDRGWVPALRLAVRIPIQMVLVCALLLATLSMWPLTWLGAWRYGWCPVVPRSRQVRRYLRLIWTVDPPGGLPTRGRLWLTLCVLRKLAVTPVWSLAWFLDELLIGDKLDATPIVAPLLEISAARSGSTQLARYLEDDPSLVAPPFLQSLFPYWWLWWLAGKTVGHVVSKDWLQSLLPHIIPPEFEQRHEGHLFRTDTFEGGFYLGHLNHLSPFLGPGVLLTDFSFATPDPEVRAQWQGDFVRYLDRMGRKMLWSTDAPPTSRLFVKGHFLAAAPVLAERFPDARFLTMVRHPTPRFRSAINFLRANPIDAVMGHPPWAWMGRGLLQCEVAYCREEQAWHTREDGPRRCVLAFSHYVRDLEGTLEKVYRECLDIDTLPAHVPREHTPRKRTDYLFDRTLAQAGVSEEEVETALADFIAWCAALDPEA